MFRAVNGSQLFGHPFEGSFIQKCIPDISIAPLQVHYYSEALLTSALILCLSYHPKALQATTSEGLAQGPYMAARVGFEPATF